MFSPSERRVLKAFRQFRVNTGEMLCFYGPDLSKNKEALRQMIGKGLLVKEKFKGGYSLTPAGFAAMKHCK